MKTMPVSEAKDQLSALVEAVEEIHETVVITRHGKPAAVLVSPDEFESLTETAFWASVPGIADDIAEAQSSIESGERTSVADLRALLAEHRAGA
ncbi:MAG: type II toxin-antitoxin system Phd/YefM family antitoxin [Micropruina sp.]|uniref:type II toxin-antitoxin system Phd/YefM family antitoxin n=1 Tax=Micropruina sp. TaxID=2737536 RepID=UPI0039E2C880